MENRHKAEKTYVAQNAKGYSRTFSSKSEINDKRLILIKVERL